jgi:hypothetical protein
VVVLCFVSNEANVSIYVLLLLSVVALCPLLFLFGCLFSPFSQSSSMLYGAQISDIRPGCWFVFWFSALFLTLFQNC